VFANKNFIKGFIVQEVENDVAVLRCKISKGQFGDLSVICGTMLVNLNKFQK
jgi:hypothetical protein